MGGIDPEKLFRATLNKIPITRVSTKIRDGSISEINQSNKGNKSAYIRPDIIIFFLYVVGIKKPPWELAKFLDLESGRLFEVGAY